MGRAHDGTLNPLPKPLPHGDRHIILTASQMAEKAGINVIYGDTDSLFIKYEAAKVRQLDSKKSNANSSWTWRLGEVYKRIFFH